MQHCHTPKCDKCGAIVPKEAMDAHKVICDKRVENWTAGYKRSSKVQPSEEDRPVVRTITLDVFNRNQIKRLKKAGNL